MEGIILLTVAVALYALPGAINVSVPSCCTDRCNSRRLDLWEN